MLAVLAGQGALPAKVVASAQRPVLVCALEGSLPDVVTPEVTFRLETLGSFLLELGARGVHDICMCGSITRPDIDPMMLDHETRPLVPILMEALGKGDDGALRAVIGLLEKTGFRVLGAHEIAPDILPPTGVLTKTKDRAEHLADVHHAEVVLEEMGRADLGQACVVRKGVVLAREDEAGTDAMLAALMLPSLDHSTLAEIATEAHSAPGAGGILFKAPKPGQDLRADMPTIGPQTAMNAAKAGLDGIVIEKGHVIVLELATVLEVLDEMEMFLWVR